MPETSTSNPPRITLFQFKPMWGMPNLSPFCIKVEAYLRMTGISYRTKMANPTKAPKKKLPFIKDMQSGKIVSDSFFIVDYLKKEFGDTLDAHLTPCEAAVAFSIEKLFEEHLYWIGVYSRWIYDSGWEKTREAVFNHLKGFRRLVFPPLFRRMMKKQTASQGMGRHSEAEIFQMASLGIDRLSDFLGEKPYFMGAKPTSLDACAMSFLVALCRSPIESPMKTRFLAKKNLVQYCDRLMARYFPDYPNVTA